MQLARQVTNIIFNNHKIGSNPNLETAIQHAVKTLVRIQYGWATLAIAVKETKLIVQIVFIMTLTESVSAYQQKNTSKKVKDVVKVHQDGIINILKVMNSALTKLILPFFRLLLLNFAFLGSLHHASG